MLMTHDHRGLSMFQAESDLYIPIKNFLESQGFSIRSEVKDCDVVAMKDEILTVIELKLSLNLKLITQAVKRQKLTDYVYVAIPNPGGKYYHKDFQDKIYLLKRLGLGLLLVNKDLRVDCPFDPNLLDIQLSQKRHIKKKNALIKEFTKRTADHNIGGKNKTKLMTAYREESLRIAAILYKNGTSAPRHFMGYEGITKPRDILYSNYYGWFIHEDRGQYGLSSLGVEALTTHEPIVGSFNLDKADSLDNLDKANQ